MSGRLQIGDSYCRCADGAEIDDVTIALPDHLPVSRQRRLKMSVKAMRDMLTNAQ